MLYSQKASKPEATSAACRELPRVFCLASVNNRPLWAQIETSGTGTEKFHTDDVIPLRTDWSLFDSSFEGVFFKEERVVSFLLQHWFWNIFTLSFTFIYSSWCFGRINISEVNNNWSKIKLPVLASARRSLGIDGISGRGITTKD